MKTSLQRIGIVFAKEVQDNLRDRRSIISALISTLIGPVLIIMMIILVGRAFYTEIQEHSLKLPVVGAENAPSLIQFIDQNSIDIVPFEGDAEAAVRNGEVEVVLIIPDNYAENFIAGRPATLQIVIDSSRQSALASVERARSALERYNNQVGNLRLLARGVNPSITSPIAVERIDVATPQTQVLIFLNMLPYFVVLVVFVGGMYVIIDTTAGERERGSLEPLLINPIPRWELVIGKLLASLPFAILAVVATLLAFALAFNIIPLEDYVGFQLTIDVGALFQIFLISLPMIVLASALQMIIATFTRSFKEAQTYVSFLPLIPALPGMGLAFLPIKANLWVMLIPTFGQQILINQIMRSEPVNIMHILTSTGTTLLTSCILMYIAIRLYQHERILFGTR